jgi:putative redox protein
MADVVTTGPADGFAQSIAVDHYRMIADEPVSAGGTGTGPTPYDLLAAALGACTSMTISFYARRQVWPLQSVTVSVRHSKIHAADCEACDTQERRIDRLDCTITLVGRLDAAQRQELLRVAAKCPVHRTLKADIDIRTLLA